MKKIITLSLMGATFLFGMSQCDSTEPAPIELTVDGTFVERTSEFAFDFLKTLEVEDAAKNYFVSPLSLHMALGMLLNGAGNGSKDELMSTLKLNGLDMETINISYFELIDKLPEVDSKVTNQMANSVWQKDGFPVEDAFKETLKNYFKAEYHEEDFGAGTLGKINQWASDNTNAKIPKVLDDLDPSLVMVLMNALYFKGDWALQFDKKNTKDAPFNGATKTATVDMMSKKDTFAFADMGAYKALDLAYGRGQYQMRVLLPENNDAGDLLNQMSTAEWRKINQSLAVQEVQLKLPKFKMEYEKKLNDVLSTMGMPTLFTGAADLSKISPPAGKIQVGFVKQNTFVAVDEEGTEAAAVTTIGIELTSVPQYPSFNVDRPFLFFIYEKTSGTIQFAGKILNLEK